jgi:uncharacterized HhH-GPD family protein
MVPMALHITGDDHADQVLSTDPFALLVGMMLDQQYPMEHAFRGPAKVLERFGTLDPAAIAAADPEEFAALCSRPPAIHRFPGSMAARLQELARLVEERYDGQADRLWSEGATGRELLRRVQELPGFGTQKAQIFTALLGKQFDVRPRGWRQAAGSFGEDGSTRSIADVVDADSLQRVRACKQQIKAAAKAGR